MRKQDLDKELDSWVKSLAQDDKELLIAQLASLKSIYPFNEYEYRLMFLLNKAVIAFADYEALRDSYVNSNPYLHLYSISPRVFGEIWAQEHLTDLDSKFKKPSKKTDIKFKGEYDLYLEDKSGIIKVEVKASRAINTKVRGSLETKALSLKSKEPYWMNYQQIKLGMADVFVFIGVWVDKVLYWVLTNEEIDQHPLRSHQHRGGVEYQIGITHKNIKSFKEFAVDSKKLASVIRSKVRKSRLLTKEAKPV